MRFDDEKHVEQWREFGLFPKIHDDIYRAILNYDPKRSGLDLCCSHGLLGQHLIQQGWDVVGIERDTHAMRAAEEHGIEMKIHSLSVSPLTFGKVKTIIEENRVRSLFARRCFPELFGENLEAGKAFISMIHEAGVEFLFIQGRNPVKNSVNPLRDVDREVQMASHAYTLIASPASQVRVMQAK